MQLLDNIKDRWITWRTGKNREQREWEAWYNFNVNWPAGDITNMFEKFRHIIKLDPDKFLCDGGLDWVPQPDALQYFWPARSLNANCVWRFERVSWNPWDQRWHIDGIGGSDYIFVATNSDQDAIMLSLRYI